LDTERPPHGTIRIACECCGLPRHVRDRDGALPTVCGDCQRHRGERLEARVARAESHEAMLRERLTACRASEALAREGLASASDRVAGALADRLVTAVETDRNHDCPAQQLGRDPQVVEFARRHRERQVSRGSAHRWRSS
jgi:hypothetical protein